MKYKFPENFLWGAATAAHQIEGNNTNNDWWHYEQNKPEDRKFPLEPSLDACDSYNRYEEDFELAKQMNNNAIRMGIEWARVEPNEGEFSTEAINHYKKVLKTAKEKGLKTFVTLHHFTNPQWLANKGRWENFKTPKLFERYAKKVAEELGEDIDFFLTINEPQVYTLIGYIVGNWPPARRNSYIRSAIVQFNFMRGHKKAYRAIKSVNENYQVGIVKNITWFENYPGKSTFIDKLAIPILNFAGRDLFLRPLKRHLDFIGLNYYFTNRVVKLKQHNPADYLSDLGWWINPGGLEKILNYLKSFNVPIYITENGLADEKDKFRKQFLRDHLISVHNAIQNGVDVKGYLHWTLIDNFEWAEGFWPRFGLIEIDRENNLERKPRPSYYYYADICKNNGFDL